MNNQKFFTKSKNIVLLASLCCLLWGSAYPAVKTGYILFKIAQNDIPSKLLFAGYRFFLAGIIVLIIAFVTKRKLLLLSKKNIIQLILLGLTQTSLQYIFFYVGLAYTTGVNASIMNGTGTFFSVILAHIIYKNDKLTASKATGCAFGFAGVIMINFSTNLLNINFNILGDGFVMLAAFILSAASIYGKSITQSLDSVVVTGYQLAIGGLFLSFLGFINNGSITAFTFSSTILLLYLALLSAIAFSLWTALLKYNKVGVISVFNFLIPVFGAVLSSIFLKENILQLKNVLALILVCIGILLVNNNR